ncbi:MAG: host-nuclease inhibitor Gam family protein [Candidatus Paceibacteria bacterium]
MARNKVAKYPIPKNEAEAARLLGELEKLKLELDAKQVALNQAVNDLVTKANQEAEAVSEEFAEKFNSLKTYATKHKQELTDQGKRRSASWATGTLGWRSTPSGISVPRSTKDIAILVERILTLRRPKFLRRKWELNVEAMEASPEEAVAIEGIKRRAPTESFYVKFTDGDEIRQKIKLKTPSDKDLKEIE